MKRHSITVFASIWCICWGVNALIFRDSAVLPNTLFPEAMDDKRWRLGYPSTLSEISREFFGSACLCQNAAAEGRT